MFEYIAAAKSTGDLPFMDRNTYERALSTGRVGGLSSSRWRWGSVMVQDIGK
jgi:hypothetical protein